MSWWHDIVYKFPEPTPEPLPDPDSRCAHLNSSVSGLNMIGWATCPTCAAQVRLDIVFNNWLTRLRELHG